MTQPLFSSVRATVAVAAFAVLLLTLGGCASDRHRVESPIAANAKPVSPDLYAFPSHAPTANVVQTGRYQLVPLAPTSGQRDLLAQAVSIDLPPSMHLTVRDGLEHALRDSGLRLCPPLAQAGFFSEPLPAVHRQLGPTTLSDALQVLAGPAWRLHANFADRTVCFSRRRHPEVAAPRSPPAPRTDDPATAARE